MEPLFRRLARTPAIFADLDGCLTLGPQLMPGAAAFFARFGPRLFILSNDALATPPGVAARLAELGLPIPAERIILAGTRMIDLLAQERPAARVRLLASPALTAWAEQQDINLVQERPDIVALARDEGFSYAKLAETISQLTAGAKLWVANTDPVHPGAGGPEPDTGALLAAIRAALPGLEFRVIGKPQPDLFLEGARRAGIEPDLAVCLGADPETDLVGPRQLGMTGIVIGLAREAYARSLSDLIAAMDRM